MSSVPVLKQAILCHCGHAGDCSAETNPDQWNFRDGYNYVGLYHSAITKQYINELNQSVGIVFRWFHGSPDVRRERVRRPRSCEADLNPFFLNEFVQSTTEGTLIGLICKDCQPRDVFLRG